MIQITRSISGNDGTFGVLSIDGIPQCLTLEPVISAIPDGEYDCIPHSGTKFQNVWEITGIPGHTAILFHNGNTINDTENCVLVGQNFANINGRRGIGNSSLTLNNLRQILPQTFKATFKGETT